MVWSRKNQKGQIELTFNWMYILIAGGVILLFFVGIVMRQKDVSEQQLGSEVLRILQSIFVGSGVSESTKNFIDTSGLQRYEFQFSCEDGVSRFGIVGQGGTVEDVVQPTFSPERLQSPRLILWSLPYKMPYKIADLLFVTSENTLYSVFGDDDFTAQFVKSTGGDSSGSNGPPPADNNSPVSKRDDLKFNVRSVEADPAGYDSVSLGKLYQVRIVDVGGLVVRENGAVPVLLKSVPDIKVSAVVFSSDHGSVTYFRKRGDVWKRWGEPIPVVSLAVDSEKNAAAYAAIFAGSPDIYTCNMRKAFARLPLVTKVYGGENILSGVVGGKLAELVGSYDPVDPCSQIYLSFNPNVKSVLQNHMGLSLSCLQDLKVSNTLASCASLETSAHELRVLNSDTLIAQGCVQLY